MSYAHLNISNIIDMYISEIMDFEQNIKQDLIAREKEGHMIVVDWK